MCSATYLQTKKKCWKLFHHSIHFILTPIISYDNVNIEIYFARWTKRVEYADCGSYGYWDTRTHFQVWYHLQQFSWNLYSRPLIYFKAFNLFPNDVDTQKWCGAFTLCRCWCTIICCYYISIKWMGKTVSHTHTHNTEPIPMAIES